MANLIGFNCPKCGGEINIEEGIRNTICPYCKTRLIMTIQVGIERYYVKPSITNPKISAKEWVGKSDILDVDMLFIPIVKIKTELMGWIYVYKKGKVEWVPGDDYTQPMKIIKGQNKVRRRLNVAREIELYPVQHFAIGEDRIEIDGLQLIPYDDEKIHLYGNVMDPPENKEYYLKEGMQKLIAEIVGRYKDYDELRYKIEPVCPHLTIYYYPVMFIRFNGGTLSVDAVRRKPLLKKIEDKIITKKNTPIPFLTFLFSLIIGFASLISIKVALPLFLILLIFLIVVNYGD